MPAKQLYSIIIPRGSQQSAGTNLSQKLQQQGVQQSDIAAVSQVSTQPGERTLQGQFGGRFASLLASNLEELSNASGFGAVPFFATDRDNPRPDDGYYALSSFNISPADPRGEYSPWNFDGTVIQKGSSESHWRAIKTAPADVTNPWGTDTATFIAIPHTASKTQWYDEAAGTRETATKVRTESGEQFDVDIYSPDLASGSSPILLYQVPYEHEYPADCRVWDDYNRPKEHVQEADGSGSSVGSSTVGNATVGAGSTVLVKSQWQRVYRTDHEYRGRPVIESGLLRLIPDETNGVLRAYRWGEGDQRYNLLQMGISSWRLHDWHTHEITPEHVSATITLEDSDGTLYSVQMTLQRGFDRALFTQSKNASAVPQGVIDRLAPIAQTTTRTASASQTLIEKREVPQ